MAKSEQPTLTMVVENGRLKPNSQYEEEVLDSYRNGAVVEVAVHQPKDPTDMKKLHAVLKLVIDQCDTPWRTINIAKTQLKLALGYTVYGFDMDGKPFRGPMPMAEMSQLDLLEFIRDSWILIEGMTGVDPTTLKKESADPGPEKETPKTNSDVDGKSEKQLLREISLGMAGAIGPDIDIFNQQARVFSDHFAALGKPMQEKVGSVKKQLAKLCGDAPEPKDKILPYVEGITGVTADDFMEVIPK